MPSTQRLFIQSICARRRQFHNTALLQLRDRTSQPAAADDDYYSLILSQPTPTPARKTINPLRAPRSSNPSSAGNLPPSTEKKTKRPDQRVLFSTPLAGPSARMRGIARGEKGLDRPPEPENCCMSGCVNCVWDAYREEVEEWAATRRKRDLQMRGLDQTDGAAAEDGDVGGEDEVGGLRGMGDGEEGSLFEGVPVGIREFMNMEKKLKERRAGRG